jgi:hypothetical protein
LAVKAGESFERNIAYILIAGGLYVDPDQPHQVKLEGKVVGDIDILATDPKSDTKIGVSCKNWETNPESKDFNHFLSMMELENLTHGILAWQHVPSSVHPLIQNAAKKGYRVITIDKTRYEQLNHYGITNQRERIEEYFRKELSLQPTKTPTLGEEIAFQTSRSSQRRTIDCTNILPFDVEINPPQYIKNAYFKPKEAKLIIHPYLTAFFWVHKEGKIPRTGEIQRSINREVPMVADAITGAYPASSDDPVAHILVTRYTDAKKHDRIEEDGFAAEILEPRIRTQETLYKMRVDLAREIPPLEVSWTEHRDDEPVERTKAYRIEASDIRERWSGIVNVPIWHVLYQPGQKGAYKYVRELLATDGTTLKDDMAECKICNEPTVGVCADCGLVACEDHINTCSTCSELFCDGDSKQCVNCKSLFCNEHAVGQFCLTCGGFVCSKDDVRCVTCNGTVCEEHSIECAKCGKPVCEEHQVTARYVGVKKRFCSDRCHSEYDMEYKQKGVLGKLSKVAKRTH